jgi:sporulation protein YabP
MAEQSEIRIISKKSLFVSGADGITGFSDREAVISTSLGILAVSGHDLQIEEFNRAEMTVTIKGTVSAVFYPGNKKRDARGFFSRVFGKDRG